MTCRSSHEDQNCSVLGAYCCFKLSFVLAQPAAAQAPLTPAENLIVEGIPPIPAAIVERANRYTEFRSADGLRVAPAAARDAHRHALCRYRAGA